MINEILNSIAVALFSLTSGVMIMDSILLLLFWIIAMPILAILPFAVVSIKRINNPSVFVGTILWTAAMLMITLSVPIYQNEMLRDCDYNHVATITTEEGFVYEDTVTKCLIRENYYSDEYRVDYR